MRRRFFPIFFMLGIISFALTAYAQSEAQSQSVAIQQIPEFTYCCLTHKGPFTDIQNIIGQMGQAFQNQNIYPTGPLIGVYYSDPERTKPEELEWEVGFPVTPQVIVQPPLTKKQWTFKTIASCLHTGPYETTQKTIIKILEWMDANGYVQVGPVIERYMDMDPSSVKPENLKTEVWIPCEKSAK